MDPVTLNTIVNIIVFFIFPWFLPLMAALCAYWYKRLIASLPVNQRAEAVRLTQMAVGWAKQELGDMPGTAKREEAIAKVSAVLDSAKLKVSPHLIDMALGEAVGALKAPDPLLAVPYPVLAPPLVAGPGQVQDILPRPDPKPIILPVPAPPPTTLASGQP
jgi:Bacteriophage holin of superfamily 6 (Holin_LLH)